ncbi:MAG: hypothetical protein LLG04_06065 [Parachlamydia sp.]|nr:hypothetical protein [Parachlamydia sp.]
MKPAQGYDSAATSMPSANIDQDRPAPVTPSVADEIPPPAFNPPPHESRPVTILFLLVSQTLSMLGEIEIGRSFVVF